MKKTICKKEYDTQNATLIHKYTHSFLGDPRGFEEVLYQTPGGLYFLYVNGGNQSIYPNEDIIRIAKNKVNDWISSH